MANELQIIDNDDEESLCDKQEKREREEREREKREIREKEEKEKKGEGRKRI